MHTGGSAYRRAWFVARKASKARGASGPTLASRAAALLLLSASFAALASGTALASSDIWYGNSSVNWSDTGNWVGGAIPTTGQDVTILPGSNGATNNFAPNNLDQSFTLNSLTLGATTNTSTQTSGYNIITSNSSTLTIQTGGFITDSSGNTGTDQINVGVNMAGTGSISANNNSNLSFVQSVGLNGALSLSTTAGSSLSFNGFTGNGAITVNGGSVTFAGTNADTSGVNIAAGTLSVGSSAALGSGQVSFTNTTANGATLQFTGNDTFNQTIALGNSGGTFDTHGNQDTLGGTIGGNGSLTLNDSVGTGTLTLTGTNTYGGGTNIQAGTLSVASSGNLGSGGINFTNTTVNGATLQLTGGTTYTEAISVGNVGGTIDTFGVANTLSGVISGNGSLTVNDSVGGGVLTLTNTNTYKGGTNIEAGTLSVASSGNLGSGGINFTNTTANNATLQITSTGTFNEAVSVGNSGGTIDTDGSTATFTGGITGNGSLTVDNSGTGGALVLVGSNGYQGGTTINSGATLQVGSNSLQGSISSSGNISLSNGTLDFHNLASSPFDYGGVISGSGNVSIDQNAVVYTNTNTYVGTTTIGAGGVLQIGNGFSAGGIAQNSTIVDNGTLIFENFGSTATISGGISGTGSLVLEAASPTDTLILTGTNSYQNGTSIVVGTLQVGNNTTAGSIAGNVSISNGTLDLNNVIPADSTFSGSIEGTGTLEVDSGTIILTNSNNFIENTDITGGTLQIGDGTSNVGSLFGNTITNNGTLAFAPPTGDTLLISSAISGSGTISQNGSGTTVLNGADTSSGPVNVTAGTLEFGGGATYSPSSGTPLFTVDTGATLAFANAASTTFASQITGGGNLSVLGAGLLTLTNTDNYSGTTSIASGSTLQVGNNTTAGGITGTSGVSIGAGGNLDFVNSSSSTFSAPISGDGSVTVDLGSTSTISFSGSNNYAGGTNIEGGTLQVSGASNLGTGSVNFTNGAVLQVTSTGSFTESATLGGGGGGTIDTDGNNVTWSGDFADANGASGSLTVTDSSGPGTGKLILTGTNIYSGGTTITSNGTLQLGNNTGSGSIEGAVTDNGILTFAYGGDTGFSSAISGSGVLNQDDTTGGTLTLSGNNSSFSGQVNILNGTLQVASQSNLGNGSSTNSVLMDPGTTLAVTATSAFANQLSLIGDPTIQVGSGTTTTWNGQIIDGGAPAGELNVTGGGTLVLTNALNSYSGGTVVSQGSTLSVDQDAELGAAGGGVTLGDAHTGGTLEVNNKNNTSTGFTTGRTITIEQGGGTIITQSGVTFEITSGVTGAGSLTVSGPGALILTGNNTYAGGTTVSNTSTLQLGDGTNPGSVLGNIANNGSLIFNEAGNNVTVAGVISGSGSLTQNDTSATPGTVTLTAADNYTGGTTITSGALQLGDGATAGSIVGNVADNGTLVFDEPGTGNTTFAGNISDGGGLTQNGPGTVILTGTSTYTGQTTINQGTLQIGNGGTAGSISASSNISDGGTLAFNESGSLLIANNISGSGNVAQIGSGTTILTGANSYGGTTTISAGVLQVGNGGTAGSLGNNGNISDGGTLAFDRSDTVTYTGVISGSGGLTQMGAGTLILTGANSFNGTTTISQGTLQLGNGGTSGSVAGNVTDNGTLAFDQSGPVTYAGMISGNGALTQMGSGTLILTGANTYSGATTISSGTLQVGTGGTSGAIGGGAISDDGILAIDRSDTVTIAGAITGSGAVQQNGAGTTVLTGADNYAGGTAINAGTLQIGNDGTAGSITGDVADNGTLAFDRSDSVTYAGVISGSGNVNVIGGGTTTFTGTEGYTGTTTVGSGTLLVNGSIATSSLTTVGTGGTIGGTGTVGKLTIANNGTIQPGSGGLGTLTVNGTFLLGPGATYSAQVTPTAADLIKVNGSATLDGALVVTPTGTGFSSSQIAILTTTNGLSGTFSSVTVLGTTTEIPTVSYNADDVFLSFEPTVSSLLPTSTTDTNQSRVANAIDFALTHDNAIAFNPVTSETGATLTQTLSELSGETAVGFQNVAVSSVSSFMTTLFDPSVGGRGGLGAGIDGISDNHAMQQVAFNGANSDMPYEHPSQRAVTLWTNFYGYQNTTDADESLGTHRTTATQFGGEVGLDYRPKHGDGAIGIAVGMTGNTWDLSDQLGKGAATAYEVGTYYSRRFFDTYLTAGLSYARYSTSTDRTVTVVPGSANLYHADFVSNAVAARAEAGHSFHTDIGRITPYANFQADDIGVPHYSEQTQAGSPSYALSYTGKQHYDYASEAGVGWNALIDAVTDIHARTGWLHDYAGGLSDTATFSAFNGSSFLVDGASPPKNAAHVLLGISHDESNVVLALNAEAAVGGNSTTYGGTASIAFRW
jgi:fibronectin-binding autotransporter adhesin